jgi:hypothetical protein
VFFGLAHPDLLALVGQAQRAPPDDGGGCLGTS